LQFLLRGYREGGNLLQKLGDPVVAPLLDAERHLRGESHLLRGFIRFSDYDGFLAAAISPKNFVLPFLAGHFIRRFSGENFMIYDRAHRAALIVQNRRPQIIAADHITFPEVSATEAAYRELWRNFYRTIAIEARDNPKCRMTQMPKRYWENMTEVQGLL
jgi:probable DNA metabolism protein